MFITDSEMPLIYSLRKKIKNEGKLCSKEQFEKSTWKQFRRNINEKEVILYGTGEMFEYFCQFYLRYYNVKYAVDKNVQQGHQVIKNGISVFPIEKILEEAATCIVLVTPINGIDKIFSELKTVGVQSCFSFPVMEYHRIIIRAKMRLVCICKFHIRRYQMEWKIKNLERRIEGMEQKTQGLQNRTQGLQQRTQGLQQKTQGLQQKTQSLEQRAQGIQQRQTERYLYLLHTNRMINAFIDMINDEEMKKEQMRYLFTEIHKNTYVPNFENPQTFNEKILSMTLYDHNTLYTEISDKYLFKQYVEEKVGKKYVVPLLGVWETIEDIDFSMLPEQFVLKSTSGGDSKKVILVKDKAKLNMDEIMSKMRTWNLQYESDYYYNFNWPFKNIRQRFIAEELLDIEGLLYYDFKVHCFHGEPQYIHVVSQEPHEVTYFDLDWQPQKFTRLYPLIHYEIAKPECLDEMLTISRKLAEPFDYIRVDFYVLKNKIYLGELTLTSFGGLAPFEPVEADYEWGKLI